MPNSHHRGIRKWTFSLLGPCILSASLVACGSSSHTSSPTTSGTQSTSGTQAKTGSAQHE